MGPPWPPPGLARPAQRALAGAGIEGLAALARHSAAEVAALHGMGPNAMQRLQTALAAEGLRFRAP